MGYVRTRWSGELLLRYDQNLESWLSEGSSAWLCLKVIMPIGF